MRDAAHRSEREPDLSIIVVSYNTAHLLPRMFAALDAARADLTLQIIVVDNISRDNSLDVLRAEQSRRDLVLIANTGNVGFARANNQAIPAVRGRYVLLLNTDAFVAPDTLQKTLRFMDENPDCGVLGVKLVGEDGSLQPSCRTFPTPWNTFVASMGLQRWFPRTHLVDDMSWDHASVRDCDWVPGCYYLTRREVIDQVGLFDPRYFLYCEEVDHCRAVRNAGWRVVFFPNTQVIHIGGESAATAARLNPTSRQISPLQIESELLYFRKHHGLAGLFSAVLLTHVGDGLRACSGLVRHRSIARATGAARHSLATLRTLLATAFASRATR